MVNETGSYRESHIGKGVGKRYDAMHAQKIDALIWHSFVKDYLGGLFKHYSADGARYYLDFACGTGRILKLGSRYFPHYTGIDISQDMLDIAQTRVPDAKCHCLDVTRSPDMVTGKYDCVSLFRFLLNAEPSLREGVLAWLSAHMEPGAVLIGNNHMETMSFSGLITLVSNIVRKQPRNHLVRSHVEEMLREAGFRVESWSGFRVFPSVMGKPVLGNVTQAYAERLALSLGLGRFGVEQIFVARRM